MKPDALGVPTVGSVAPVDGHCPCAHGAAASGRVALAGRPSSAWIELDLSNQTEVLRPAPAAVATAFVDVPGDVRDLGVAPERHAARVRVHPHRREVGRARAVGVVRQRGGAAVSRQGDERAVGRVRGGRRREQPLLERLRREVRPRVVDPVEEPAETTRHCAARGAAAGAEEPVVRTGRADDVVDLGGEIEVRGDEGEPEGVLGLIVGIRLGEDREVEVARAGDEPLGEPLLRRWPAPSSPCSWPRR